MADQPDLPTEPQSPRATAARAIRADVTRMREAFNRDAAAGPLALLSERRHPLVRAEVRRFLRRTRGWTAVFVAFPLAFVAVLWALIRGGGLTLFGFSGQFEPAALACFATFWPALMVTVAAYRSVGAVLAERAEDTALQIVLTPMPKRTIAAAKVLPHVRPCLWGILAALPAYALAGGLPPMTVDTTFPTPFLVWPYRCFGLYLGSFEWPTPVLSAGGCMAGVFMGLTDLGLVWAAAHWGAGLAVTLRRLPLVAARLVLGLAGYCLAAAGYALLGFIPASLCVGPLEAFSLPDRAVFGISGSLVMVVFLPLFWLYPLRWATRACLEDFAWFDRLAMDSSEGWEREPGTVWQAWWDDSARP